MTPRAAAGRCVPSPTAAHRTDADILQRYASAAAAARFLQNREFRRAGVRRGRAVQAMHVMLRPD